MFYVIIDASARVDGVELRGAAQERWRVMRHAGADLRA